MAARAAVRAATSTPTCRLSTLHHTFAQARASTFSDAVNKADAMVQFGGRGHTSVLFSTSQANVDAFSARVKTVRVLINMPASQGAIGGE